MYDVLVLLLDTCECACNKNSFKTQSTYTILSADKTKAQRRMVVAEIEASVNHDVGISTSSCFNFVFPLRTVPT